MTNKDIEKMLKTVKAKPIKESGYVPKNIAKKFMKEGKNHGKMGNK